MSTTMDDLASAILNTGSDEAAMIQEVDEQLNDDGTQVPNEPGSGKRRSLRRGFFKAANLQDKLLEKLISQVIPVDDLNQPQVNITDPDDAVFSERPGFTVTTMSTNFRRFNARIGVVFKFQARAMRVLFWRRPSHTLSLLAVYTFVCLDPYLLFMLPLAICLLGVLVPSFVARHPEAPQSSSLSSSTASFSGASGYSPRGPPLAPARTVKPVKELSRDFFRNMGDLQNVMEDFSVAHDKIIEIVVPKTNFSDEALSSEIFVLLSAGCLVMSIAAHLLPWRFLMLGVGWAAIWSNHPTIARIIRQTKRQYLTPAAEQKIEGDGGARGGGGGGGVLATAQSAFDNWVRSDIILDEAPETREVEIFELQRLSATSGEWEPWLFSPSPYDPLSASRITGDRPRGTRFFEDVLAPEGWEWSEKKWALDLWSREWVEERIITGVEVETEGERWVYDIYNEHEATATADGGFDAGTLRTSTPQQRPNGVASTLSWEEGEEGMGRRGEWRRRRWVRTVKRKMST